MGHKNEVRIVPIIQLTLLIQEGLYCKLDEKLNKN